MKYCDHCGRSGAPIVITKGKFAPYFYCSVECSMQHAAVAVTRLLADHDAKVGAS